MSCPNPQCTTSPFGLPAPRRLGPVPTGGSAPPICYYPRRRNSSGPAGLTRCRLRAHVSEEHVLMSTDIGIDLSRYQLGWSDEEDYVFKPKRGLERGHRPRDVVDEGRAGVDARQPAQVLRALRAPADAQLGRRHVGDLLRRHLLLHQADRVAGRQLGRAARRHQEHLREARHPRGRAQVPRRRHRAVRDRGRVPPQPGGPRAPGRHLLRHGHRAARVPRARQAVLRHDHPEERQQVRRPQHERVERRVASSTCRPA